MFSNEEFYSGNFYFVTVTTQISDFDGNFFFSLTKRERNEFKAL